MEQFCEHFSIISSFFSLKIELIGKTAFPDFIFVRKYNKTILYKKRKKFGRKMRRKKRNIVSAYLKVYAREMM